MSPRASVFPAQIMRFCSGVLAPFGWLVAIYGVVLVFPLIAACIGTWLLGECSFIARAASSKKRAASIWVVSLVFNLAGAIIVCVFARSWDGALWAISAEGLRPRGSKR